MSFYPVLHVGVTLDGRIITTRGDGNASFIDDGASSDEVKVRVARTIEMGSIGAPWIPVPGKLGHEIIAEFGNGKKITADMAGFVYNDASLLDKLCGAGTYERVMPFEEVTLLQLARPFYQECDMRLAPGPKA